MKTARDIALEIKAEIDAIPNDGVDGHRSRRCRLKVKRLKEVPKAQLFDVKTLLENMLAVNRKKSGEKWGKQHGAFFGKGWQE